MRSWNDITLYQYQQLEVINRRTDLEQVDKSLFAICALYDMSEHQLDKLNIRKVGKLSERIDKVINSEFKPTACNRFGEYSINYDPSSMRFGQYVELASFFRHPEAVIANAHSILASISHRVGEGNRSEDHAEKSEFFLTAPVQKAIGTVNEFAERFRIFNHSYEYLFDSAPAEDDVPRETPHPFLLRFGWIYNATQIAEHERISLDDAFGISVTQALNDLVFLKERELYFKDKFKK